MRMHVLCRARVAWLLVVLAALPLFGAPAPELTFKKQNKTYLVGGNPNAIVAVDLNDDGLPEIVTADTGTMDDPRQEKPANDKVSLLVARGPLDYVGVPSLVADFAPYAIAAANMDAQKLPDLVVASFMAVHPGHHRDVSLFRNLGGNLFEPLYFTVPDQGLAYSRIRDANNDPVFSRPGLTSIVLADFNHDNLRDVVATGWSSDVLAFFPGAPNTYLGDAKTIPAAEGPRDVKAADFDGDGELDLCVALYVSNEIGLWKGDGKGNFAPAARFSSRGRLPAKIQLADVNGDGKLDIVVVHCFADDSIVIFYGDGGFSFALSQEIVLGTNRDVIEHEIRDVAASDLNDDSRTDLAAACYASGQVVVFINTSKDSAPPQSFRQETYVYEKARPRALCVADLNKDGAKDIAVALWDTNSVAFLLGTPPPPKPVKAETPKPKPSASKKPGKP